MLDAVAGALDARRAEIIAGAGAETNLTQEELAPEFARMVGTLRMFAGVVREGSWVRAAIDRPVPAGGASVGPNHDVRRMLVPLGPVAVFGSSNFPLAYGVCGGDTASAWAAGCPAVVKEHPAHPRTGRLLAEIARAAIVASGADAGWLGYAENTDPKDYSVAAALVRHPAIAAVGFTGSIPAGLAIEKLARERDVPIPVFAEMGSVNPVFVTPGAMAKRPAEVADALAASVLARVGQQCTKPGEVFIAGRFEGPLRDRLAERFNAAASRAMAAPWIRAALGRREDEVESSGAARLEALGAGCQTPPDGSDDPLAGPTLWATSLTDWLDRRELREEMFGPSSVIVEVGGWDNVARIPLGGHLTLSVFFDEADPADAALAREVVRVHGRSAGRIIYNGVPTGVRVAHGMVHGGPHPATNRPDTTAVGPYAIERWCRPVCWQNAPQEMLPEELRDDNPKGIWRMVDGQWGK